MGTPLGLIAGSGQIPLLAAQTARALGYSVVAFPFDDGADPRLASSVDRFVPVHPRAASEILQHLLSEGITRLLFSGKVSKSRILLAEEAWDPEVKRILDGATDWTDEGLLGQVVQTLGRIGIEILDQRPFLTPWLPPAGCLTTRIPTDKEWVDIRHALGLAALLSRERVGQTVVLRRGVVLALEALEGTTEAIRRGCAVGGRGAIVAKAVRTDHDFRFDTPAVGVDTLHVMVEGGATTLAVEAGRVLLVDREVLTREAGEAGIAIVAVGPADGPP